MGGQPLFDEKKEMKGISKKSILTHWHYYGSCHELINDKCQFKGLYIADNSIPQHQNISNNHAMAHFAGMVTAECFLEKS